MGLELVEFIMAVEEEFEINIPDDSASDIITIQDVVIFVDSLTPEALNQADIRFKILNILNSDFKLFNLRGDEKLKDILSD